MAILRAWGRTQVFLESGSTKELIGPCCLSRAAEDELPDKHLMSVSLIKEVTN